MEFKKSILIMVLAIFLVSIAGVCAADANDTQVASEDNMEIDQTTDDVIGVGEDTDLASSEENEILTDAEQTFAQLNTTINGNNDKDIYLNGNYKYSSGDNSFKDGIVINRDVNIYGNGTTIDGNKDARIFQINGGNVVFYNIIFVNGDAGNEFEDNGGAINGNCKAINCTFTSNHAYHAGAMFGGSAVNCSFSGNSARFDGGAIYYGSAVNCSFSGNSARFEGGAIYYGSAVNCSFSENIASNYGGAMRGGSAVSCSFSGNIAANYGGAMYGGSAVNCSFSGNFAVNGDAMYEGYKLNCTGQDNDYDGTEELVLHWDANNFTTIYGSDDKLHIQLKNQNNESIDFINYDAVIYKEGSEVRTYHCLSNDELALDLLPGIYTAELTVTYPGINQPGPKNITLTVTTDGTTFWDLNKTINDNTNDTITLDKNYTYNPASDYAFTEGIVINRQVTINGNGYTIDAKGKARVFNVQAEDVTIENLTIKNANYDGDGGAVYFAKSGRAINCNFIGNEVTGDYSWGGAIYMYSGDVTNCNFTDNQATGDGGAIYFAENSNGSVTNCNFAGNSAPYGGAIRFIGTGDVTNCNFTNNSARYGGAVLFYGNGNVTNCNFDGNNATTGSAIYFDNWVSSYTLTISNSTFLNNKAKVDDNTPLNVIINGNNITVTFIGQDNLLNAIYFKGGEVKFNNVTYWGAQGITNTGNSTIKPSRSNKEAGQNITVKGIVNGNIINEIRVTDENGEIVLGDAGDYWVIVGHEEDSYYTNVAETLFTNMKFYANVTSQTTTNKTVNITAKSNIKPEVMPGKLLFILPNGDEINATYAANGTWWAVHTFDDYTDYQVNASYIGLSNVILNNATIRITKVNSTVNVSDVVLNYGEAKNVTVKTEGATRITAMIDSNLVSVINNYTIPISGLDAGTYTLTVTTIADADHNPITKNVKLTVTDGTTFWDLNNTINDNINDTITLDRNYAFNSTVDAAFTEGIVINRQVTINGNGYTIDAKGKARIFYVTAGSINITDVTLKNGKADTGGAIYFSNDISNSNINATYINNKATNGNGGANYFQSSVSDSNINGTYTNNTADIFGGASYFSDSVSSSNVSGTYNHNTASRGGANYFSRSVSDSNIAGAYAGNNATFGGASYFYGTVSDSNITGTYTYNTATGNGGANNFYDSVSDSNITGTYINNTAAGIGGANCFRDCVSDSNITGTYINNTAAGSGGANRFDSVSNSSITGTYTNNTSTDGNGGANYFADVSNSSITGTYANNTAAGSGGANLFYSVSNSSITGTYANNTATASGGANHFEHTVSNSNITGTYANNNATNNGGANHFEYVVSNSNISGTYANNAATNNGGANYFGFDVSNSSITGTYANNTATDGDGGANYFGSVSNSNITGTYANNTATNNGGANYFSYAVSNSNITGTYTNNKANGQDNYDGGGANYFNLAVSNSDITGTYTNNTATQNGGANHLGYSVSNSSITGTYTNNAAAASGGANYFYHSVSNSCITGTYANNTATQNGGANHFDYTVSNSNITGTYINNAASGAIIHFQDLMDTGWDSKITNAIFLNNKCEYEVYASTPGVVVKDSWFGNNASNYMNPPRTFNVQMDNWLFLNATADYSSLLIMDSSNITFKLYSTNSSDVSVFDNSKLPVVNLTLTATNGEVSNSTALNKSVEYRATKAGQGSITASVEDAEYTIFLDNNKRDVDLDVAVNPQVIDYGENAAVILEYNATATGTVNITLKGKNGNNYTFTNIALNATILLPEAINADEYEVNIIYSGDIVFLNATANGTLTVNKVNSTLTINDNVVFDYNTNGSTTVSFTNSSGVNASVVGQPNAIVNVTDTTITVSGLAAGNYTLSVTTITDENHNNVTKTVNITVNKASTEIILENETMNLEVTDIVSSGAALNPSVAGNLTYTSGNSSVVKIEDGKIMAVGQGQATVTVSFNGNENYTAAENRTVTVTVSLKDASVSVNNSTLNLFAGDNFTIVSDTVPAGLNVTFVPDNSGVYTVDENGFVTALMEGTGSILVKVGGNGVYAENSTNITVTVSKIPTEIIIDSVSLDLSVGDETVIVANLTPAGAGNVTFTSSNDTVVIVDAQGNVIAQGKGQAIITVSFAGDNKYAAAESKNITVTVSLNDASVTVDNNTLNLKVGETYTINATKHPDTIMLDITYTSSNSSVVTVDEKGMVTAVGEGTAIITVEVGDDEIYAKNSTTVTVTVNKQDANVIVSMPENVAVGQNATVNVKLPSDATGNVTLSVDGTNGTTVSLINGTANFTLSNLGAGSHSVNITYTGDDKYAPWENKTSFTVNKISTKLTADKVTATYNVNKNLVITLKDANGNALSGVDVTVKIKGSKTYTTDKNGQVKVNVAKLVPKTYTAKISFAGNAKYAASSASVKVKVKKAKAKMVAKKKTFKAKKKVKKYTITLKDNKGKPIKKAKVTLKVKGKTYKAKTNSKGKATFKIKNLKKKGTYKAVIKYKGNKYYKKLTKKVKIKVKKSAFKTLSKGNKDKITVKRIQQALKDHGYYLTYKGQYLKIDGIYHGHTERSVKEFQKDKGLKVTGKVDEKTAKKLGIL